MNEQINSERPSSYLYLDIVFLDNRLVMCRHSIFMLCVKLECYFLVKQCLCYTSKEKMNQRSRTDTNQVINSLAFSKRRITKC